ncbi:MAG: hypothetical protein MUO82_05955 [Candidatus Thermoplasmatota archaeon]|nr:hypothetical protein [Candidatus Thermoplasmatota archaeon]
MRKVKALTMTITFWVLLIILSSAWLVFLIVNNLILIQTNIFLLLVLIVAGLSFALSMYFIFQIIFDIRVELKRAREKEKNIREIIQYEQLLEPPSIYN